MIPPVFAFGDYVDGSASVAGHDTAVSVVAVDVNFGRAADTALGGFGARPSAVHLQAAAMVDVVPFRQECGCCHNSSPHIGVCLGIDALDHAIGGDLLALCGPAWFGRKGGPESVGSARSGPSTSH